jgi:hypothetical protein
MKKLLIIFLFVVAISCKKKLPLSPTRVEGVVYDKETNLPIENAIVTIIKTENYGNAMDGYDSKKLKKTAKDGSFSGFVWFTENKESRLSFGETSSNYTVGAYANGYQTKQERQSKNSIISINKGKKNENLKIELIKNRNVKFLFIDKEPMSNVNQVKIGIEEYYIDQGTYKMRSWRAGIFTKDISGNNNHISFVFEDRRYRFNFGFYYNDVFVSMPVHFTEFDVTKDLEMEIYY